MWPRYVSASLDQIGAENGTSAEIAVVGHEGIVGEAAGHLQDAGLMRYKRGHSTVLDRNHLEHCVCECYAVVKKEYGRLLPNTLAI